MSSTEEPSDSQIQELVDGLFVPERSADYHERLKIVGNRAVSFLVAALNDPHIRTTVFDSPIPQGSPDLAWPLYRIGELLATSGSEAAAVHFSDYLTNEDQRFREYAAWGLGSIALESCVEPVSRILAGEDRELRTSAMTGIRRALAAGGGGRAFFKAIRASVEDLLDVDYGGYYELLVDVELEEGTDALSPPERNYFAASLYYYEICNGGPWQYFGNSTADYHGMIVAGLRAIDAPRTAQTLEDAGKVFGPEGPPKDREARYEMMDTFSDQQEKNIDELYSPEKNIDNSRFPSGEDIEMLLFLYVVEHRAEFREYPS